MGFSPLPPRTPRVTRLGDGCELQVSRRPPLCIFCDCSRSNGNIVDCPELNLVRGMVREELCLSAFISNEGSTRLACQKSDAADAQLENACQEAQISEVVGTSGVEVLLRVVLRPQGRSRVVSTGTQHPAAKRSWRTPTWGNARLPGATEPLLRHQRP